MPTLKIRKFTCYQLLAFFCWVIVFQSCAGSRQLPSNTDATPMSWRTHFPKIVEEVTELPNPDSLYIFFMAGQSNMAGRGFVEPSDTVPNKRILTLDQRGRWIYAKEPLHFYEPKLTGLDCGLSFARELLLALPSGFAIAMIPCAVGGSSIEQWLNNETFREVTLQSNLQEKIALVKPYGKIAGILWHQGESNAKPDLIPYYAQRLDSLIQLFRGLVQNDSLPILLGELGPFAQPEEKLKNWKAINDIIHQVASKDDLLGVIHTRDLEHKGDYVHFNTEAQRELGKRFATKYLELMLLKQ